MKNVWSGFKHRVFGQFVGDAENNRANFAVFVGRVQNWIHVFAIGVRVIAAGFGSVFVNHAIEVSWFSTY